MNFEKIKENKNVIIILIAIATIIYLQSCVSIINMCGQLSVDVAVWTNIARRMQQGCVIYKDMFDHKGPILYFMYYIGYSIAGIKGIGLVDYCCCLIDVFVIYKISRKFNLNKKRSIIVVFISMLLMSFLCCENPCTESIALSFILISLYGFVKFMQNSENFGKIESIYTRLLLGNSVPFKTKSCCAMDSLLFVYIF